MNLTFSYKKDLAGPIAPQVLSVSSTGQQISFSVATSTTPPGGKWLSVSTLAGVTPAQVSVTAATGFPAGRYSGFVTLFGTGANNNSVTVPVELNVTESSHPPVVVRSPGCTNDICVSFRSIHAQKNPNEAIGVLSIINLTGAWYELSVDFNQTTVTFDNQLPVILLAPYGAFVTTSELPITFKKGDILQLNVDKAQIDSMGMFLIDLTLRAFLGVSFPTSNQGLLDFRIGVVPNFLGTINGACADSIASTAIAVQQHDVVGILTGAVDLAACLATNPVLRGAITDVIKSLYNDATGELAGKWLNIAGDGLARDVLIFGNAAPVLELLGSEFVAPNLTTIRLVATQ